MFKILQKTRKAWNISSLRGFSFSSASFPSLSKMSERVVVKHFEGDERFTFSFHLKIQDMKIDKQFNLNRELGEETGAFLERLTNNLNKANKSKGKKNETDKADLAVTFVQDDSVISATEHKTIQDFLFLKNLQMQVHELSYDVIVNPPLVREFKMSDVVMTELMIYPHLLRLDFADSDNTKIEWFVSQVVDEKALKNPMKKLKNEFQENLVWTKVHEGFYFTPAVSSINCMLKCEVTPFKGETAGEVFSHTGPTPITSGPGVTPSHSRQVWTTSILPTNKLRVTSYNLLADLYADSDYSRTVLFAQCPAFALAIDYRVKLILSELIGYNSDIITLQECDRKVFELHLTPILDLFGFCGSFAKKGGQVDEGLATFYRREKFKMISFNSTFLPEALNTEARYSYILDKVKDQEQLLASLTNRTTTVSISVLQCVSGELIVVGNTHLYFSPNADHIRLIQVEMCRMELEMARLKVVEMFPESKVTVMLCGDFNSTPPFGVLEYMTGGSIGESHSDWRSQEGEEVVGLSLKHHQNFISAAKTPQFTNYTQGFKDCLDYIFIEEEMLEVEQVVPFPSEEELSQHIALPNIVFPSDHVAVVVDLKWRS